MTHLTDWCAEQGPRPCACADDGETDTLVPTVDDRRLLEQLTGEPWVTLTPNPAYL